MTLRLQEKDAVNPETLSGIQDGGHILIECSNCQCPLVDVWITRPHEESKYIFEKIRCPWCLDYSFQKEVKGGFHLGYTEYCEPFEYSMDENRIKIVVLDGENKWTKK